MFVIFRPTFFPLVLLLCALALFGAAGWLAAAPEAGADVAGASCPVPTTTLQPQQCTATSTHTCNEQNPAMGCWEDVECGTDGINVIAALECAVCRPGHTEQDCRAGQQRICREDFDCVCSWWAEDFHCAIGKTNAVTYTEARLSCF